MEDPSNRFNTIAKVIRNVLQSDLSIIWRFDKTNHRLVISGWDGKNKTGREFNDHISLSSADPRFLKYIKKGQITIIPNIKDPNITKKYRNIKGIKKEAWQSLISMPLSRDNKVFGIIDNYYAKILNLEDTDYKNWIYATLETYANQAIEIIKIIELEVQLQAFEKILPTIRSHDTLERRLYSIVDAASEILGATGGKIYLKVPGENQLELMSIKGVSKKLYPPGSKIDITEGVAGATFRSKKPLIVKEYRKSKYAIDGLREIFESVIEVPLFRNSNEVIGVLAVFDNKKSRIFSYEDDVPVLQRFAKYVELAVEDAKRLDNAEKQIKDLQSINNIVRKLSTKLDTSELCKEIVALIENELKCTHCTLFFPHQIGNEIILKPTFSFGERSDQALTREFKATEGLIGLVFKDGKSHIYNDASSHPQFAPARFHSSGYQPRSMLIVPIKSGENTIGIICADQDAVGWFHESDQTLVDTLASHITIALERANSLGILHNIGSQLIYTINAKNIEQILEQIISGAINITNANSGVIHLLNSKRTFVVRSFTYPTGYYHPKPRTANNKIIGLTQELIEKKETIYIPDASLDDRVNPEARERYKTIIGLPLIYEKQVLGVLYIKDEKTHFLTEIEKSILEILANHSAFALANYQITNEITKVRDSAQLISEITAQEDLPLTLQSIAKITSQVLDCDIVTIHVYDKRSDEILFPPILFGLKNQDKALDNYNLTRSSPPYRILALDSPYIARDTLKDTLVGSSFSLREDIRSTVALPLVVGGEKLGVLFINYRSYQEFSTDQIAIINYFANLTAIAIRNNQLLNELLSEKEHQVVTLRGLHKSGQAVMELLDINETLKEIVKQAFSIGRGEDAKEAYSLLALVENNTLSFKVTYPKKYLSQLQKQIKAINLSDHNIPVGIIGRAYLLDSTINVADVSHDKDYIPFNNKTRSQIVAPIRDRKKVIGLISIEHPANNAFDNETKRAVETLAGYASIAIQNAKYVESINRARNLAGDIAKLTVRGDLYNTLDNIVDNIKNALNCDIVVIHRYDQDKEIFVYPPVIRGNHYKIEVERNQQEKFNPNSVLHNILALNKIHISADTPKDYLVGWAFAKREGIKSTIALPLKVEENKKGVMFVSYRNAHHFESDEISDIQLFADQAAIAIHNSELVEKLKRQVLTLEILHEAGQAIENKARSFEHVLEEIAHQAYNLLGDRVSKKAYSYIRLVEENTLLEYNIRYPNDGTTSRIIAERWVLDDHPKIGVTGRAIKTGETQIVSNILEDNDYILYDPNTKSEIATPIKFGDKVTGVISIEHPVENTFDNNDRKALETLAVYASTAIEISQLVKVLEEKEAESIGMLEETLEERGELIGQIFHREIAHDIKNLMEVVNYSLESLAKSSAMRKFSNIVKKDIIDSTARVEQSLETIQGFLNLAEESDEKAGLYEANSLINQAVLLLDKKLEKNYIDIDKTEMSKHLPKVKVNRLQFIRVVYNLIDNAIDALSLVERERKLKIKSFQEDKWVRIDIVDNGVGIKREDLNKLFSVYFSTKGRKGRGLGLAGSKRIVESYKGKLLNPISQYGKGTTFTVLIPTGKE